MAKDHQLPELVFVAPPDMGHLLPMVKIAQMIIARSANQISAFIPIIKSPYLDDKINYPSLSTSDEQSLNFLELPSPPIDPENPTKTLSSYMRAYTNIFEQALLHRYHSSSSLKLSGFILDMFCTPMIDLADKLGAPSYIFFASGVSFLSMMFRLESLHVDILEEYGDQSPEKTVIDVAGFNNPVPLKVWPHIYLDKDLGPEFIGHAARFRRAKGIIVNTFIELESSLVHSLSSLYDPTTKNHGYGHIPPIYPVGPILNITVESRTYDDDRDQIMNWLDSQPPSSVVFLCFGSRASFNEEQVKKIAVGLERSGQRFLWSLRKQPDKSHKDRDTMTLTSCEYDDFNQVLPEGFLERTVGVGKVIGWAPQVAVLGHRAVGAFVSHCGWNSTLESLWFGVPMLTWPSWAEQQLNAFLLVKELGLAVEIKLDHVCNPRKGVPNMVVRAEELEMGIRKMMEQEEGDRVSKKVKKMSEEARKALLDAGGAGSSYQSMGRFLDDCTRTYLKD